MSHFHEHFFIITGAPESGKTTLLNALEDRYFLTMPDSRRAIIQDQTAIGGKALPWEDPSAYAELMLNWDMRSYREASRHNRPVLFDRGIPDIIGYLELNDIPVPAHLTNAAERFRYHKKVFIAPCWPEIDKEDYEKKNSLKEAQAAFDAIMKVYRQLGYELLTLPKENLDRRIQFITDHLDSADKNPKRAFFP